MPRVRTMALSTTQLAKLLVELYGEAEAEEALMLPPVNMTRDEVCVIMQQLKAPYN